MGSELLIAIIDPETPFERWEKRMNLLNRKLLDGSPLEGKLAPRLAPAEWQILQPVWRPAAGEEHRHGREPQALKGAIIKVRALIQKMAAELPLVHWILREGHTPTSLYKGTSFFWRDERGVRCFVAGGRLRPGAGAGPAGQPRLSGPGAGADGGSGAHRPGGPLHRLPGVQLFISGAGFLPKDGLPDHGGVRWLSSAGQGILSEKKCHATGDRVSVP